MDIGIKHPKRLHLYLKSYEELYSNLNTLDWDKRGYMLYSKDRSSRCSLINIEYKRILNLVNNQVDLKYVMLENSLYTYKIDVILEYFPEYNSIMTEVVSDIKLLQQYLFSAYIEIFCKKTKTLEDFDLKYKLVLTDTYTFYKDNRKHDITFEIHPEDVYDMITQHDCPYVYTLLYK